MAAMRGIAAVGVILVSAAQAQTDASPHFEVASVKPAPPSIGLGGMSGGPGTSDPALFTCNNCILRSLVVWFFHLASYEFSPPDWMDAARFDVTAKVPPGTSKEDFQLMQQNFLIERFNLKFHREQKETQIYELVVAQNGPKFEEAKPRESRAPLDTSRPKPDADGFPILPPGTPAVMRTLNWRTTGRFAGWTMERFVQRLSTQFDPPVLVRDATGLTGNYDFTMRWVDERAPGEFGGPNIFEALEKQLGLKLERRKGMINLFVIDHIEKTPTEN
jgi:uncharacterized protein (TIGR03435 family)